MYAFYAQVADKPAPPLPNGERLRFAGHVAFYGPCIARFDDSRTTGAPLLMLIGGRDAITDQGRCAEIAADLRRGGSRVDTIVYPEAVHQWDGAFAPRLIGRNLAGCSFRVERDGTIRSEEHTSELQSQSNLVCRLLLEKKKKNTERTYRRKENSDSIQRCDISQVG